MRKRKDISIILLLAAGLFAGCSHSNEPELKNEIAVKTGVTGLQKRVASINNNTDLQAQDIKIDAYFHDTEEPFIEGAKLHYNDSEWKFWDDEHDTQIHYYWPIEGSVYTPAVGDPIIVSSIDYVGFCPYTKPAYITTGPTYHHTTGVTFTCNLGSYMTNTAQADISEYICAYIDNQTKDSNSGSVNMSFQHPFTRIQFQLSASHPDIKINKITYKALKSGGICTFDGSSSTWTSLTPAGTVNYVMTLTGTDAEFNDNPDTPRQIGDDWIIVPQTFSGNIEMNATWIDWGEEFAHNVSTTISSQTWEPGYSYTYTFTIRETDLRVNVEKYTEQW